MAEAKAAGLAARSAALGLMACVMEEGQTFAQVLALRDGPLKGVAPQDRARAQRLALQVIRQMEPVDRLLEPLLRKEPPLAVMNILRLAVTELHDGAAAHGVVNAAGELARQGKRTPHMAGLINAVLRKIPAGAPLSGPPQRMPRWLRQPLVHAYGREAVTAIEAVQAVAPPLDITPRGTVLPEGEVLPTGSIRLRDAGQVSALPGYDSGDWWVQDAARKGAGPLRRTGRQNVAIGRSGGRCHSAGYFRTPHGAGGRKSGAHRPCGTAGGGRRAALDTRRAV